MTSRDKLWLGAAAAFLLLASTSKKAAAQTKRLTLAELRQLARVVGFPNPELAAAVAMAESGGRPDVVVPEPHGSPSYGLWQIHLSDHPQYNGQNLLDPRINALAALSISSGGINWQPWSAFNNGSYRQYLPTQGSS
jgi:hypothetical protein